MFFIRTIPCLYFHSMQTSIEKYHNAWRYIDIYRREKIFFNDSRCIKHPPKQQAGFRAATCKKREVLKERPTCKSEKKKERERESEQGSILCDGSSSISISRGLIASLHLDQAKMRQSSLTRLRATWSIAVHLAWNLLAGGCSSLFDTWDIADHISCSFKREKKVIGCQASSKRKTTPKA